MRTKTDTSNLSDAFGALAELPEVVEDLRQRIVELESRLLAPPANDTLLDTAGAAKLLAMTPEAVRQAAYRGTIPCVRVGRRLRFRRSELLAPR
jgi:excisionase family DNA binding protein